MKLDMRSVSLILLMLLFSLLQGSIAVAQFKQPMIPPQHNNGLPVVFEPFTPQMVASHAYLISGPDASRMFGNLTIPDNVYIAVAPGISQISWIVSNTLTFGRHVTIDLSPTIQYDANPMHVGRIIDYDSVQVYQAVPIPSAPAPARGPGVTGAPGQKGTAGAKGRSGVAFDLTVKNVASTGLLWIRTDGMYGQQGGAGGPGGQGGLGNEFKMLASGSGGRGGDGANGGPGGDTATVHVDIGINGSMYRLRAACAQGVAPSALDNAHNNLNDGTIFIYGAPGAGSDNPGGGGPPGPPGDLSKNKYCQTISFSTKCTSTWSWGASGTRPRYVAPPGACIL